ncbi:MAG: efflux RND transporter periplasmic adaptor subunit [Thermoanaerobaculia bacterium]
MSRRWIGIAAGVVVLTVIVVASVRSGGNDGEKVYVEPVTRRNIESIVSAPGAIDPRVKVNISAHVIGKIEKLYFEEGDTVKKGQKLVELEKVAYQAAVERSRAELASRRIELHRARVSEANAELQFKRAQQLQTEGIQAQQLYEDAQMQLANAKAALMSADEGVRQAQATLEQTLDDLSRTTILAPMSGKIVQLNAHEGEVVITGTMNNPGSVIAVLADLSEILAVAEVGETEVVRVHENQTARIHVDAIPDKEYQGHVVEIGSSAQTKTASSGLRYFNVKVAIDNADDRLRPGMTAQVDIVTDTATSALSVPVQSVVERVPGQKGANKPKDVSDETPKKKYVFVLDGEKVHQKEVTTGISNDRYVVITSGLTGKEKVVTGPFRTLKKIEDGAHVTPEVEGKGGSGTSDEGTTSGSDDERKDGSES